MTTTLLLLLSMLFRAPSAQQEVLFIQGIFSADGKELVRLSPVRRAPLPGNQTTPRFAEEGVFSFCVFYGNGDVDVIHFDALVADDSGKTYHGFFELIIPIKSEQIGRLELRRSATQDLIRRVEGADIQH